MLYFWEDMTNTFRLPNGMTTPTLFNMAANIGICPTDKVFDPTERDEDTINFDKKHASFDKFIIDHHEIQTEEVLDKDISPS